jgi:hypothetical protein
MESLVNPGFNLHQKTSLPGGLLMNTHPSPQVFRIFCSAVLSLALASLSGCAAEQAFPTSQDAVDSLVSALRNNDSARLQKILGTDGDELLSSGDPVADQNRIKTFLNEYDEKHGLEPGADGAMIVVVGKDDWPMPIPVVKDAWQNSWHFDVKAGKDEVLNRRIGRNELDTIQTCLAIVDAQRDYSDMDPEHIGGGKPIYAQRILSDPGQKNGLYWPTKEGEPDSPMGPLVASAASEGYTHTEGKHAPYHGYFYHLLKAQGPAAPGGEMNYIVDGKMSGGFALVAYPAEYGNSGIMTFIVNENGVLFSRDLGSNTSTLASQMSSYDPGAKWSPVIDTQTVISH